MYFVKKSLRITGLIKLCFVQITVNLHGGEKVGLMILKRLARFAEKPLQVINTLSSNIAVKLAAGKCDIKEVRVKSVKCLTEREDVYNMTVLHNHNYAVQDGIISKNCDSVRYCIYRIVRSDPDFMDLRELSRENIKEHGYLNIKGVNV